MSLLSTAVSTCSAAIGAIGPEWNESQWPWGSFLTREPSSLRHLSYALGVPSLDPGGNPDRQRRAVGMYTHATLGVRFAYAMRSGQVPADYRAALAAQEDVLKALAGADTTSGFDVHFVRSLTTSNVTNSPLLALADMTFTIHFRTALQ